GPLVLSESASNVPSLKVSSALPPWPVVDTRAYHQVCPPGALAVPASCQYTVQIPDVMFGSSAVGGASRFFSVKVTSRSALPALDLKNAFWMSRSSMFCPCPPG